MAAYWIAHVVVKDPQQYTKYTALAPAAFARYGARFLARGGKTQVLEGVMRPERSVVIEFDSFDDALRCYHSQQYQQAMAERMGVAFVEIIVVEGV
ncbi:MULTISPECIES: DUF1330 domain-containing protein [Gibbsiella]|uniref:DUF1330 domain-containing protein n=1 Tax=Gibbsiella dentisursi TaxID=796890 RepID=A0ABP7KRQ8_9GAMM|nr:DUF1330 domain-containing protein [Gibbsiella quercinecans]